jgi:hypothetical protein
MYWVSVWTVHGVTLRIVRIVYCRADKKPPSVPILSHINPLHTLQSLFLKIPFRYFQITTSSPRPCVKFCNIQTCFFFYYERFLCSLRTPTVEYHPQSAVHICSFSIFEAILHIRRSCHPISNLRKRHVVATGTHSPCLVRYALWYKKTFKQEK